MFTNLDWKNFQFAAPLPESDSAPSTSLVAVSQSEIDMTLESALDAEDSFDDLWASNSTGFLHSSDLSPVEYSNGSTPSLDVNVLKVELNLMLGFVLGASAVLVLARLFF